MSLSLNLKLAVAIASEYIDVSESEFVRQAIYIRLLEFISECPDKNTKEYLESLIEKQESENK